MAAYLCVSLPLLLHRPSEIEEEREGGTREECANGAEGEGALAHSMLCAVNITCLMHKLKALTTDLNLIFN